MFGKSSQSLLAIDLAADAVRVLEVSIGGSGPVVSGFASEAVAEGSTALPQRHLAALEKVLSTSRMRSRRCVAAVPTNLVTTRSVLIDPGKPQPPEEQVKQTLQNILSQDAADLLFDFWKVSEANTKTRNYEVLVVATQRSMLQTYLAGFKKLRLNCMHMDVAPCALASLIAKLIPQSETPVGTVAIGETHGYFAVVDKQKVLFWRPFELPPPKNGHVSGLERVGDEISKCVSHMVGSQHLDCMIDVIAFGAVAQDQAFAEYLASRFNLQIKTPSPFDALAPGAMPAEIKNALQPAAATFYATALGLALQPIGGANG